MKLIKSKNNLKSKLKKNLFIVLSVELVFPQGLYSRPFSLIQKRIPGMEEAIRKYGHTDTVCCFIKKYSWVDKFQFNYDFTRSTKGAVESLNTVFPENFHLLTLLKSATQEKCIKKAA